VRKLLPTVAAALLASSALPAPAADEPSPAGDLSSTERRIVAAVEAGVPDALALLEATVDVNSGTLNTEGVRRVGEMFRAELDRLGLETRWVDGEPFGRAGHLVAEHRPAAGAGGGEAPRILLIGHLDTVFEPDSPFQRFERLPGDVARGPGVNDMKGGNVVIVLALRALAESGALDATDLTVILTGDEESVGSPRELARRALVEAADAADVALGFEDGDGLPTTAVIARRGSTSWHLTSTGTPAHSSQIFQPEVGYGGVFEAARVLDGFRRRLAGQEYLTFNPGAIVGGTTAELDPSESRGTAFGKSNVVAERAEVRGDLRTLTPEQLEAAKTAMREVVADSLPGTRSEIVFDDAYPPMPPTDGNRRLLALLDRVSRDLGHGPVTPVDPGAAGAADVSFAAPRVAMAIDGLGLMGPGDHTVEETADLSGMPVQAARAALLIHRLSVGGEP
jgi:glutamate carboxypeptidase